jgi:hypothetical protein
MSHPSRITQLAWLYHTDGGTTYWVADQSKRRFNITVNGDNFDFNYINSVGINVKVTRSHQEIINNIISWGSN